MSFINEEQRENLEKIFDKNRKIETDSDLLELAELTDSEVEDADIDQDSLAEILAQAEAFGRFKQRQRLVKKHGEEKADEILLNRELGELRYVYNDEDEDGDFLL